MLENCVLTKRTNIKYNDNIKRFVYILTNLLMRRIDMAGGPGVYVFGQEEAKELAEVIDGKYLFRYGLMEDKNFKKGFYL